MFQPEGKTRAKSPRQERIRNVEVTARGRIVRNEVTRVT